MPDITQPTIDWHRLSTDDTASRLHTDPKLGLSQSEAESRLARYGPNRIREGRHRSLAAMFLGQFADFMILVLLAAAAVQPAAGAAKIKLATLAPDGSPWHRLLQEMGDRWQRETDGRVRLVIYPGGVAGDDGDTLRKIRIGQLQAATLTVNGKKIAKTDNMYRTYEFDVKKVLKPGANTISVTFASAANYIEKMQKVLDLRIRHEGWEVELRMRAEAARMQPKPI